MSRILFIFIFSVFLSGCQQMLEATKGINNTLSSLNSGMNKPYIDEGAKQSISLATNKANPPTDATGLFNEAKPALEHFIGLIACNADDRQLAAYVDPDKGSFALVKPHVNLSYHKSGCLNVLRINGIQRKAANTLYFKVQYLSPQSEESTSRNYLAIKQPDGEWLFAGSLI